ncbi:MAG: WYL domain-containing transcriptional regulator [Trueperaceae bacterium]
MARRPRTPRPQVPVDAAPTRTTGKAARLTALVDRLALRPHGVAELARAFGVTRRTVERDLIDLRTLGHDLTERDHRYALKRRASALNEVEALAVHSATRLLIHTGVGERHYRRALEKLVQQLPDPARGPLIRAVDDLAPGPDDRILDLVAQAWFHGRVLRCRYASARSGRARWVELQVWFYELNRRNLKPYVLAYERLHAGEVRIYKLARMERARLLADRYVIPSDFDPLEHMRGAWGIVVGEPVRVRIRAAPEVAFWFRERRADGPDLQVTDEAADGSLTVEVHGNLAADGDLHELLSFLLGWGPKIEVLDPPQVRERIATELRAAAARYDADG